MSDPKKTGKLNADDPLIKEILERLKQRGGSLGTARLGRANEVVLSIAGNERRINMKNDSSYLLGRFSRVAPKANHIDLDPYDAFMNGVSRIHAQIHMNDGVLYVTDMDSTNGTHLDDVKLIPHNNYKLPSGSTLVLGRLHIDVIIPDD